MSVLIGTGRLAVVGWFRGKGLAGLLIGEDLRWIKKVAWNLGARVSPMRKDLAEKMANPLLTSVSSRNNLQFHTRARGGRGGFGGGDPGHPTVVASDDGATSR